MEQSIHKPLLHFVLKKWISLSIAPSGTVYSLTLLSFQDLLPYSSMHPWYDIYTFKSLFFFLLGPDREESQHSN